MSIKKAEYSSHVHCTGDVIRRIIEKNKEERKKIFTKYLAAKIFRGESENKNEK